MKKEVKNKDYGEVLNQIKIALYILIALFAINIVVNIITASTSTRTYNLNTSGSGTNGSGSGSDNNDESDKTDNTEYDVSSFNAVTYDQLKTAIKSDKYTVVYIGRSSCGYCAKFLPMLKKGQEEYGFTTTYFDITQVINFSTKSISDQDAYDGIKALDTFFEEFGATPMVAVFKDGKFVKGTVGYTEYETYATFLEDSGLTKK